MVALIALVRLLGDAVQGSQTAELWGVIAAVGAIGLAGGLLLGWSARHPLVVPVRTIPERNRRDPVRAAVPLHPQIAPDAAGVPRPRAPGRVEPATA